MLAKIEANKDALKKQGKPGEVIDGRTISNITNNKQGNEGAESGKCKC